MIDEAVLGQCTSLVIPKRGIKWTDAFRKMIKDQGKLTPETECYHLFHSGMSCSQYIANKSNRCIRDGLKYSFWFSLVPNLITGYKSLRKKEGWKRILKKWIRSIAFYSMIGIAPWMFQCWQAKITKANYVTSGLPSIAVGMFVAFMCEDPKRHIALAQWWLPKSIQILFQVLEHNGYARLPDNIDKVMLILALLVVTIQSIREYNKQLRQR